MSTNYVRNRESKLISFMKEVTIRDIFGGGEGHEFLKKA